MEDPCSGVVPSLIQLFGPKVTDILRMVIQEESARKQHFNIENILYISGEEASLSFRKEAWDELQMLCSKLGISPEVLIHTMIRIMKPVEE
jgi:hypothetical protein